MSKIESTASGRKDGCFICDDAKEVVDGLYLCNRLPGVSVVIKNDVPTKYFLQCEEFKNTSEKGLMPYQKEE